MIETLALRSYREEFTRRAEGRREDELRDIDVLRRQEKKKEERQSRDEDSRDIDALAFTILASESDITAFSVTLDTYDTATVEALMANEAAMKAIREELRVMLDKAYVLPDGRKVFMTEDGTQIFDEHGAEVSGVDPHEIEDWRPPWEEYSAAVEQESVLANERKDVLAYQTRLDEARDTLDEEGLTKQELEELKARLNDEMPDAVRAELPERERAALKQDAAPEQAPRPVVAAPSVPKLDLPAI